MTPEPPEFPSPSIVDSRRLFGANVYSAHPGALLEVIGDDELCSSWARCATHLLRALGWPDDDVRVRPEQTGATLFLAAPVDVLMTATDVNEQAWVAAESREEVVDEPTVARLRAAADEERRLHPNFVGVYSSAAAHEISLNFDDESLCLGSGVGARIWPWTDVPTPEELPWRALSDVPIALVTGSNGKTTTTRLVAAMWRASGKVAGWCCSDGVWVGDTQIESGDYSGPAGARDVLRHSRVEAAVLETARGGILRRGLAVTRARTAIITNISADHFGEYGIASLADLADAKGAVAHALESGPRPRLVLNADDVHLVPLAARVTVPISWFSCLLGNPLIETHIARGGDAATVVHGRMILRTSGVSHDLGEVAKMPLTLDVTAPHNVANLLGACLVASAMGVSVDAIRDVATTFGASASDNPGRLQIHRFGGATVLTDYAHNPDGLRALCTTAQAMPAARRLLIVGQAGNREDELIRALPRAALGASRFDRVIVKEMPTMLRGRTLGEVPRVLTDELVKLGVSPEQIEIAPSEIDAVRRALSWARDGDLLVCPVHVSKAEVYALLERLRETGWAPGIALPELPVDDSRDR